MQYNYIVKSGQSLVDIALQEYGTTEGVLSICNDNDLSIGTVLTEGTVLVLDTDKVLKSNIVGYYERRNITITKAELE